MRTTSNALRRGMVLARPFYAGDPDPRFVGDAKHTDGTTVLVLNDEGRKLAEELRAELLLARRAVDGFESGEALHALNTLTVAAAALAGLEASEIPDGEVAAAVAALLEEVSAGLNAPVARAG